MNLFLEDSEDILPAVRIVQRRPGFTFSAIDQYCFPVFRLLYPVRAGFLFLFLFSLKCVQIEVFNRFLKAAGSVLKFNNYVQNSNPRFP
jgi:hypothetical protein